MASLRLELGARTRPLSGSDPKSSFVASSSFPNRRGRLSNPALFVPAVDSFGPGSVERLEEASERELKRAHDERTEVPEPTAFEKPSS